MNRVRGGRPPRRETVRFVGLMSDGEIAVVVGRRERELLCPGCQKLHPYNLMAFGTGDAGPVLFDSRAAAERCALRWLPDQLGFMSWREVWDDPEAGPIGGEDGLRPLPDRTSAIEFQLS